MLAMRQKRQEEAFEVSIQAVSGDSKNHMAHYYYASLLQSVTDDGKSGDTARFELMRQHLKKAIELKPDFINAYDMLGYVALMLHQELTETEELMKKVLNAAPARRDIRLRLAELMIANKEPLPARVVLKPLIDSGEDDYYRIAGTQSCRRCTKVSRQRASAAGIPTATSRGGRTSCGTPRSRN
jgi:tetratricopeptide (TPR) repeat protein